MFEQGDLVQITSGQYRFMYGIVIRITNYGRIFVKIKGEIHPFSSSDLRATPFCGKLECKK